MMPISTHVPAVSEQPRVPVEILPSGWPLLYEDDEEGDLGETNPHLDVEFIVIMGLRAHLASRPELQVYGNMNLYYSPVGLPAGKAPPYVSPDAMVVQPFAPLPYDLSSYQIGREGPVPLLTIEALSERTAQQRDLDEKMDLYALLGVREYLILDPLGRYLPEKLLLKTLQKKGTWKDQRDPDGGITSKLLGFRVIIDVDGRLRLVDFASGKHYPRPDEAVDEANARREAEVALREAEEQLRALEADLAKLKGNGKNKGKR